MPETKDRHENMPGAFPEINLKKPRMYAVIMHNDDYTTMEFVVEVLRKIFKKELPEATAIMLDIHKNGSRVVSVYTYDIAVTKANQALTMASDRGYPLLVSVKEAEE